MRRVCPSSEIPVPQSLDLFEFLLALFKLIARLELQRENPFREK